jgi:hypothetical protein
LIFCSRLPKIHLGTWHVHLQSRSFEILFPLQNLKKLTEAVPS